MNIEAFIAGKVQRGEVAEISIGLLERSMYEPSIKHWIDSTAKKLECKAIIHSKSDVVTFYPKGQA